MGTCIFWGHRDCPPDITPALLQAILQVIVKDGVDTFYIGNQGQFDQYVLHALKQIKKQKPDINFAIVLAYHPTNKTCYGDDFETVYPEMLIGVPPRFAIDRRNQWMLGQADIVICYIRHQWGGAARYVEQAKQRGKKVINLYQERKENQ